MSNRLVASWIPARERGLANGLIFTGVGLGAGVSPPLITWIMVQHGWRTSFILSAALGLIAGSGLTRSRSPMRLLEALPGGRMTNNPRNHLLWHDERPPYGAERKNR